MLKFSTLQLGSHEQVDSISDELIETQDKEYCIELPCVLFTEICLDVREPV